MNLVSVDFVRSLLIAGKNYSDISMELQQQYPLITRGLSARSVRRYVKVNKLKEFCSDHKAELIERSVQEVSI